MLDLQKAPPGIKEYADLVANLTNVQLFERIAAWPEREESGLDNNPQLKEAFAWTLRCEIEDLRRRLGTWLAVEGFILRPFSGLQTECPMCSADGKNDIKTCYHKEPDPDSICRGRLEEGRRHLHRGCKKCGYEWLEACAAEATQ